MPALSELAFRWETSEPLGIRFVAQGGVDEQRMHADREQGGATRVLVQECMAVREIQFQSKRYGMTCTHTIVPGMVVEAVQGRDLEEISPEAPDEAKLASAAYLNNYTYAKDGPLTLHFREERGKDGTAQGHPAMVELHGKNVPRAHKRRASIAATVSLGLVRPSVP